MPMAAAQGLGFVTTSLKREPHRPPRFVGLMMIRICNKTAVSRIGTHSINSKRRSLDLLGEPARLPVRSPGEDRAALRRIRESAEQSKLGRFDWTEWKSYRDEGHS
jgi:hypothetical protein